MKVLLALTYYRPHVSGLTIYVERLAKALVGRGHQVTVLTSHYESHFAYDEVLDGVHVVRVPVLLRVSKGVLMPSLPISATRLIQAHDVVSIHLPQAEAAVLVSLCKVLHKPAILTYHCDLQMPPAALSALVDRSVFEINLFAAHNADTIVAYTEDFATHSPLLARFMHKVRVIAPPVVIPPPTEAGKAAMRERMNTQPGECVIGFAARFAAEKGADYLINALPDLLANLGQVRLVFAGEYKKVLGETIYERLQALIQQHQEHLTFLGQVPPAEMANFFALLDCLVVASINSTESFGLVQVEAMLQGTPVVATNLPGVRQPVKMTGMGEIVPIKDSHALAEAITKVIQHKAQYIRPRAEIAAKFDLDKTVSEYERLFEERIKAHL